MYYLSDPLSRIKIWTICAYSIISYHWSTFHYAVIKTRKIGLRYNIVATSYRWFCTFLETQCRHLIIRNTPASNNPGSLQKKLFYIVNLPRTVGSTSSVTNDNITRRVRSFWREDTWWSEWAGAGTPWSISWRGTIPVRWGPSTARARRLLLTATSTPTFFLFAPSIAVLHRNPSRPVSLKAQCLFTSPRYFTFMLLLVRFVQVKRQFDRVASSEKGWNFCSVFSFGSDFYSIEAREVTRVPRW